MPGPAPETAATPPAVAPSPANAAAPTPTAATIATTTTTTSHPTPTNAPIAGAPATVAVAAPPAETSMRRDVRETLRPVVVFLKGSKDFGLEKKRMLREGEAPEIGGWLRRVKGRGAAGRQFGEAQYYMVDEAKGLALIKNDEVKEFLRLEKMLSVTAHAEHEPAPGREDAGGHRAPVYFFRVVALVGGEQRAWELSPADMSDRDLVVRWTCALQLRSKTYDVVLDLDHEKAVKVALWCQSLYRGFKGRVRAERIRAKRLAQKQSQRFAITKMVSGLLGSTAGAPNSAKPTVVEDTDDEDEQESSDDDEDESAAIINAPSSSSIPITASSAKVVPGGSSRAPFLSGLASSWLSRSSKAVAQSESCASAGDNTDQSGAETPSKASTPVEESKQATPKVKFPSDKSLAIVVDPSQLPRNVHSGQAVIEDEIWENQRWSAMALRGTVVYRGWSEVALLPTERGAWTDRSGTMRWESIKAVPVPPGWHVMQDWTLDLQSAKCNSEGWQFAQTFAALDANLASGRSHSSASARWLVRRRRWFRIREQLSPEEGAKASPGTKTSPGAKTSPGTRTVPGGNNHNGCSYEQNLLHAGWLGMRGVATGRWSNYFAFLPNHRPKETLGVALCYFKKSARVFNEDMSFRYPLDDTVYRLKNVRVKFLDNMCVVSDAMATRDSPGLFSLHLSGEQEPRVFNAHSAEARKQWVEALAHAISASPGPCYEAIANRRSMRKGAAWEFSRASGAVKGIVEGSVRGVKHGLLHIKHITPMVGGMHHVPTDLHRADSDPDIAQVNTLREELRRSDAPWQSSPAANLPRRQSTDSSEQKSKDGSALPKVPKSPSNKTGSDVFSFVENRLKSLPRSPSRASGGFQSFLTRESPALGALQQQQPVTNGSNGDAATEGGADDEAADQLTSMQLPKKRRSMKEIITKPFNTILRSTSDQIHSNSPGIVVPPQASVSEGAMPPSPDRVDNNATLSSSGTFEVPPPFENIMFDGYFPLSVDDFDTFFFREEEFTRDILIAEKMTDIELEPWTNGLNVGSEHRRRYKMPRVGVVPPGTSLHLLTRTQTCQGKGYAIDQVCSTPEMPFGQHFSVDFRNVFIAEGPHRCRVIISQRTTLFKPLMAQSFIRNGTKREITAYYKNFWTAFVRKWIQAKRPHLIHGSIEGAPPPSGGGESGAVPASVVAESASGAVAAPQSGGKVTAGLAADEELASLRHMVLVAVFVVIVTSGLVVCLMGYAYMINTRLARMEELLVLSSKEHNLALQNQ